MTLSNVNPSTLKTDVLIVGAGPSGLMAAQALGRLGVDVTVIERRSLGEAYGNADGLQPRTLEIWQSYGMLDKIAAKGALMIAMVGYEMSKDSGCLVRSRPASNVVVSSRYPYEITASIADIEATLRENAENAGVKFLYSSLLVSLDVDEELKLEKESNDKFSVKATIESTVLGSCLTTNILQNESHPTQTYKSNEEENSDRFSQPKGRNLQVISAKYVIGADGAYSWVRRSLNIVMEGEQTEDVWGVVDVTLNTDFPDLRFKCIVQSSTGPVIIIPREGEKVRIYVGMSSSDRISRREDGRLDKSTFDPTVMQQKILERIRERLLPYTMEFTHVFWSTIFSTAQKVASRFSYKNRVFISGDACHTHSPKAGQGANASMGDAHNLAWKLAYVLRGWASPSILETYETERREYALELISFDKVISMSLEGGTAADYQRLLHKQNLFTSGTGIAYSSSKLTLNLTRAPRINGSVVAGERFPFGPIIRLADWHPFDAQDLILSDGKFKMIIFPGDILQPRLKAALDNFSDTFRKATQNREPDEPGFVLEAQKRLSVYTIVHNSKEDITWKDIPSLLSQSWKCFFSVHEVGFDRNDLYCQFGLYDDDQTSLVLVRPDGYISIIEDLEHPGLAELVVSYMYSL